MKLIITRGIPASGKSTWANAWVAEQPDQRVRVNRDELRHMLFGKWHGVNEDIVSALEWSTVNTALRNGMSVVVDATHLHPRSMNRWVTLSERTKATFIVRDFDVPDDVAILRDANRSRSVGADVIRAMRGKRDRLSIP